MRIDYSGTNYSLLKHKPLQLEQSEGVEFLLKNIDAILAFQTGYGKTLTSLTALEHWRRKDNNIFTLILCPVNAVKPFLKELKEFGYEKGKDIGMMITGDMNYDFDKHSIFITTYTALEVVVLNIMEYLDVHDYRKVIMIIDEGHKLQSDSGEFKKVVNEETGAESWVCEGGSAFKTILTSLREYTDIRWSLTATPVLNNVMGIYNHVSWHDPEFFGCKKDFMNEYVETTLKKIYMRGGRGKFRYVSDIVGPKNEGKLRERLKDIMLVKSKKYNIKYGIFHTSLTTQEEDLYESVSKGVWGDKERDFSARLHDLQRLVDNTLHMSEIFQEYMLSARLQKEDLYFKSKETLYLKALKGALKKDCAIIVYVDYRDTLKRIKEITKEVEGVKNVYEISGDTKREDREKVEDIVKPGDVVIITSAGTASLNLQKCNALIFYDIPYKVLDIIQAIGRIARMDSKFDIQYVLFIYTSGTIDEYKFTLFSKRADLVKEVVGAGANLPKELSSLENADIKELKELLIWRYKSGTLKKMRAVFKVLRKIPIYNIMTQIPVPGRGYNINLSRDKYKGFKRSSLLLPESITSLFESTDKAVIKIKYRDYLNHSSDVWDLVVDLTYVMYTEGGTLLEDDMGFGKILLSFIIDNKEDLLIAFREKGYI